MRTCRPSFPPDTGSVTLRTPIVIAAVIALGSLAACGGEGRPKATRGRVEVVATVNGVPITQRDLELRAKTGVTGEVAGHSVSANVLQTVVREELIYQKALQLGLDREEEYRLQIDDLEAQLRAFRRKEMAARFRRHMQQRAGVTEAEARAHFDENAETIRTRFHVLQLFSKGKQAEMARDVQELASGTTFEEVAARRFPGVESSGKGPWDLGELRWYQLPPAWRGVVDRMEPGQVSDVIKGENDRYWVIKLVSRTIDPGITFETERERIVDVLRQQKAADLYASTLGEMKGRALVVYSR
jgi:parvulin-like peptidyl-prolyl isomerase